MPDQPTLPEVDEALLHAQESKTHAANSDIEAIIAGFIDDLLDARLELV
jgi:hypothetical protein